MMHSIKSIEGWEVCQADWIAISLLFPRQEGQLNGLQCSLCTAKKQNRTFLEAAKRLAEDAMKKSPYTQMIICVDWPPAIETTAQLKSNDEF